MFLDGMIDGQLASEHEFAHLLGRVRFAQGQPAALLIIDNELGEGKTTPASLV
jgi:ferritin